MKIKSPNARSGLLAGGNWIIDQVKLIDIYPQPEQLGNIRSQSQGTGGAPYNVLIDLAKSGAPFPLLAAGLVGKDALGEQIIQESVKTPTLANGAPDPEAIWEQLRKVFD